MSYSYYCHLTAISSSNRESGRRTLEATLKAPLPTTTIDRPVTDVYAYLTDETHEPDWAQTYALSRQVENYLVSFSATDEDGRHVDGTFTLESAGRSTRVVVDCRVETSALKRLFTPGLERGLRQQAEHDLDDLRIQLND